MAERLAYRRRAFRDGYGRFGFVPFGPGEAGPSQLLISLPAVVVGVAGSWSVRETAPLPAAAIPVAGTWTARLLAGVPAATAPVTGSWALLSTSEPLLIDLPAAAVPVTGSWALLSRLRIALPAATAPVTGSWAVWMPLLPAYPDPDAYPDRGPATIILGGVDISAVTLVGFTFSDAIGQGPRADITVDDLDGVVPWPPAPGWDVVEDPDPAPELIIRTDDDGDLFGGPLTDATREYIYHEEEGGEVTAAGWRYHLIAEGWQRNLALSPVFPLTTSTVTVEGPYGTVTRPAGPVLGVGDDGSPVTDVSVIRAALWAWTGPPFVTIDVPYRTSVSWTLRPRGDPLDSVLGQIADRLGTDDAWWVEGSSADLAFRWRPGFRGGVTELHVPVGWRSSFDLAAVPTVGHVVPTRLSESAAGGQMREGVSAAGSVPSANATVVTGPPYAGRETMSVDSPIPGVPAGAAGAWMAGRRSWRRTVPVELPPGAPIPRKGRIIGVHYPPFFTTKTYFIIRSVTGKLTVQGEGINGIEWTMELGDSERRSFVYEVREAIAEAAAETPPQQTVELDVGPWEHHMAVGSRQYIPAHGIAATADTHSPTITKQWVELHEGTVTWTLVLVRDGDASAEIEGSIEIGWWFTENETPVVWNETEPLGYAYCEFNRGENSLETDAVDIRATYHPTGA